MTRLRPVRRAAAAGAIAALTAGLIVAAPAVASAEPSTQRAEAWWSPSMHAETWEPGSRSTITVDTFEFTNALPSYQGSLREFRSGQTVKLGRGYADWSDDGQSEGPYSVDTRERLEVGATYLFTLKVRTTGFWYCSVRDPDGCSWLPGETRTHRWRFTHRDGRVRGSHYTPPKVASHLRLSEKTGWGVRGWKVRVQLTRAGRPLPRAEVIGQTRGRGGWRYDGDWRTDKNGGLVIVFRGAQQPAQYRFRYHGAKFTKPATSRSFTITARRR